METQRLPRQIDPKEYVIHRKNEVVVACRATPSGVLYPYYWL